MRSRAVITLALLAALFPFGQPGARNIQLRVGLHLPWRKQNSASVVSGDYVKGEAVISRVDGTLAKAFVKWDFDTALKPKLAVLLKGQGRVGEWRDLYIIDTALGTFTHVNEQWFDRKEEKPIHGCAREAPVPPPRRIGKAHEHGAVEAC